MIILASETSTLLGSVALFENGQLLAYKESPRQGSHSDTLNVYIEQVLQQANKKLSDVDLFASGIGPGSFTGIRITLNAMKTFSYCYNKPLVGVDSLKNLAWLCKDAKDLPVVAMINAYKNMLYIATYRRKKDQLVVVREPEVIRVQNLSDYVKEKSFAVGDGYVTYEKYFHNSVKNLLHRSAKPQDDPTAVGLAELVDLGHEKQHHWSELLPVYLRASEAEENRLGIKYQPLD